MELALNSLTTKKTDDKISSSKLKKIYIKSMLYHIKNSNTREQNSVDLDEVVHHEPPHQDLRCLQNSAIFVSGT